MAARGALSEVEGTIEKEAGAIRCAAPPRLLAAQPCMPRCGRLRPAVPDARASTAGPRRAGASAGSASGRSWRWRSCRAWSSSSRSPPARTRRAPRGAAGGPHARAGPPCGLVCAPKRCARHAACLAARGRLPARLQFCSEPQASAAQRQEAEARLVGAAGSHLTAHTCLRACQGWSAAVRCLGAVILTGGCGARRAASPRCRSSSASSAWSPASSRPSSPTASPGAALFGRDAGQPRGA